MSNMKLASTEGTYLYSEEASWAAIGTNLANRSGPVTLGSVGLTGRAFTRGAPRRGQKRLFYWTIDHQKMRDQKDAMQRKQLQSVSLSLTDFGWPSNYQKNWVIDDRFIKSFFNKNGKILWFQLLFLVYYIILNTFGIFNCWLDKTSHLNMSNWAWENQENCHYFQPFYKSNH